MTWIDQGIRFDSHGRGQNIPSPKLDNFSRADYHDVYRATGLANTWFNECSASMTGEDEDDYPTPVDPMLPTPPGEGTGPSIWDYAPDFSNNPFHPYPPVKKPDGSNITRENLRGTRLYDWKGCTTARVNNIQQAFRDMNALASQEGVYRNIDWTTEAAPDFLGPDIYTDPNFKIPDDTRSEIQSTSHRCPKLDSYVGR